MTQNPLPKHPDLSHVRHVRAPVPLYFPDFIEVPESSTHLGIRTFLSGVLRFTLGDGHSVHSGRFVYWNPRNPKCCVAPDVLVRLDQPQGDFRSWKTWECGGVPQLAVEIIRSNDFEWLDWDQRLERYHELGVQELVCFDPEKPEGARLRVWDLIEEDLVEREIENDTTPCATLQLTWVVAPIPGAPFGLRLVDLDGNLVPSELEAKAKALEAAEARVRELEELLRQKGG
ncbi:Uma2 family endonuclease [Pendulispora albinea]|uniref:Uma2 family endonuclease n=1 Tax=Pendulispora albinea TaxID=2741071 RepID=A0ABZ2M1Q4_9BACT